MKISPILLGLSLAAAGSLLAAAQDASTAAPPKILQINREWLKPGKAGLIHDKTEAPFVSLMNRAKIQGHYVALNSMSGKSRALYISRYPSFEAWEADNKIFTKNAAFGAELDRDIVADAEQLDGLDQVVYTYDEELSYHPHPDVSHARYYEISIFHVRPGHRKDWYDATKTYKEANDKAGTTAHWAAYEIAYGGEAGTYIVITARNSLTEVDTAFGDGKKLESAVGKDGMQKLDDQFWQAVDSARTELFSINPRQSYAEEAWIKSDPEFWKPKADMSATKQPAKQSADAAGKTASATPKPASR